MASERNSAWTAEPVLNLGRNYQGAAVLAVARRDEGMNSIVAAEKRT